MSMGFCPFIHLRTHVFGQSMCPTPRVSLASYGSPHSGLSNIHERWLFVCACVMFCFRIVVFRNHFRAIIPIDRLSRTHAHTHTNLMQKEKNRRSCTVCSPGRPFFSLRFEKGLVHLRIFEMFDMAGIQSSCLTDNTHTVHRFRLKASQRFPPSLPALNSADSHSANCLNRHRIPFMPGQSGYELKILGPGIFEADTDTHKSACYACTANNMPKCLSMYYCFVVLFVVAQIDGG